MTMVCVAVLILAAAGFWISLYFTLVYYRILRSDARWVPIFCRMDADRCEKIIYTRYGRLLGLPNSLAGIVYYIGLGTVSLAAWIEGSSMMKEVVRAASAGAALVSIFLFYSLIWRLKTPCPL